MADIFDTLIEETQKETPVIPEVETDTTAPLFDDDLTTEITGDIFDQISEPEEKPSFFENIGSAISERAGAVTEEITREPEGITERVKEFVPSGIPGVSARKAARLTGQAIGAGQDIIGTTVSSLYENLVPEGIKNQIAGTTRSVLNTSLGQIAIKAMQSGSEAYQAFKTSNPETAKDVEAAFNIASIVPAGKALNTILPKTFVTTVDKVNKSIRNTVRDTIFDTLQPKKRGKVRGVRREEFIDDAAEQAEFIVGNKNNIELLDEAGNPRIGSTPKTFEEWGQASDQSKKLIWRELERRIRLADDTGGSETNDDIIDEMLGLATNPDLELLSPELSQYAASVAERFRAFNGSQGAGTMTPSEVQRVVARMNQQLKDFYKSDKSAESAGKKYIDQRAKWLLDQKLDRMLEKATGEGSTELKRTYKAFRALDEDIDNRIFDEFKRKSGGLLQSFSDLSTTSSVISAIAFGQPKLAAVGAAIKGANAINKFLRNPNRKVSKLFNDIDLFHQRKQSLRRPSPRAKPPEAEEILSEGGA